MDSLWQKEANQRFYIDIFKIIPKNQRKLNLENFKEAFQQDYPINRKDDAHSTALREEAVIEFNRRKYHQSMKLCNESLCFAENDSDNIILAYAMRAKCFYFLRMFKKCLVDVELATKLNYFLIKDDEFVKFVMKKNCL